MVVVFPANARQFERYLGDESSPERGIARIARLVGSELSNSMGAGIVTYEKVTVDWDLPFDEVIVVLEGAMRVHSSGETYDCVPGDVAWFPAHRPLCYEVPDRVVVFYVTYPVASNVQKAGSQALLLSGGEVDH